ncbi:hypothetical protein J5226_22885 [Lysobacter sp. K5869]|uniref:hypothetical protein n=1 Tax=Lysobacter sp. K5869 TaxID=2820808 RepID=UPI001C0623EA|nr:hypothetical protein [Lysobacter sp. K5869]QWP76397.1 hypothetical protein J5226_22885 [Lysobacter sp. K5869]
MDTRRTASLIGSFLSREGGLGKSARLGVSALVLLCCFAGASAARPRAYVAESFAKRLFLPTVHDQSELVRAYGPGWVTVESGMQYRWYHDAASDRWLRLASDTGPAPLYRTIDEMLVLSFGPPRAVAGRTESLASVDLFGVKLGSPADDAIKAAKRRHWLRRGPAQLLGQRVEEIEFTTRGSDDGMIYRYYLREGKVVGLAVGITE